MDDAEATRARQVDIEYVYGILEEISMLVDELKSKIGDADRPRRVPPGALLAPSGVAAITVEVNSVKPIGAKFHHNTGQDMTLIVQKETKA